MGEWFYWRIYSKNANGVGFMMSMEDCYTHGEVIHTVTSRRGGYGVGMYGGFVRGSAPWIYLIYLEVIKLLADRR